MTDETANLAGISGEAARAPGLPGTAPAAALATLVLAAAGWTVLAWRMTGMNMGVATRLGSVAFFAAVWVAMMAAMMLPGAAPAVARADRTGGARAVPLFAGSYLAVWAAGLYEFTPLKRHFRPRCHEPARSGFGFGLCCLGATAGLMAMQVALGVMSIGWMALVAILVTAQKILPPRAVLDVTIALVIVVFGIVIIAYPSSVPGLIPHM